MRGAGGIVKVVASAATLTTLLVAGAMAGTPAVAPAAAGDLWMYGTSGTGDTGLGMAGGTSPSIAGLAHGGYEAAFQANTGILWVTGSAGTIDTGLGMAPGTSPGIAALAGGGYEVAFQAKPPPPAVVVAAPVTTTVPLPPPRSGHRRLRIKVTISWTWNHAHTRLTRVRLGRRPHDTTLEVRCRGRGCPRARARVARSHGLKALVRSLSGARYHSGDRIFITLSAARYASERIEVTIRNGTEPAVKLL